jgi:coproporphyrinogen III oxidase-like Fe-S oxidoreductase
VVTDVVLKRLRTVDGLDLQWVRDNIGEATCDKILHGSELARELGLAVLEQDTLRLTDPGGLLVSNTIISNLFVELMNPSK